MNLFRKGLLISAGALGIASVAGAHHSFSMFIMEKEVTIKGTVRDFQWTNPHIWIQVIVPDADSPGGVNTLDSGKSKIVRAFGGSGKPRDEEVASLKRELARVKKERDFLREAATFFARGST